MNALFKWSGLLALVLNLGMAVFVYLQGRKNPVNVRFALFSACIGLWAVGSWLVNTVPDEMAALWLLRVNYAFGVFVPVLFGVRFFEKASAG